MSEDYLVSSLSGLYLIEIFNSVGQMVLIQVVQHVSNAELNVSSLTEGYYSVRVVSENGIIVKPLIIAR
ncbi:MAG TPA: hypothetical protein DCR04_07420 [Flavobacteriales bacterium]|nr:hypothetical protein [Flavobacteriales bacterium]